MTLVLRILYVFYRLVMWVRYRTRRRFTPAGWLALTALVAAAFTGFDTENTVAYQAFTPLLCLILIAWAFSWYFPARFSVRRQLPRFGTVGTPFAYQVAVKNLTKKKQDGLFFVERAADPPPGFAEWKAKKLAEQRHSLSFRVSKTSNAPSNPAVIVESSVPSIPPGAEVETRASILPLRRGVLRFAGASLVRLDPLGLCRSFSTIPEAQSTLILPRRYALPPIALPGTRKYQEGGVALASSIGRSDEFVSLRDYRRGDPYRNIHWRSWAKTGKPIVKEFEDEFFVRHALILDTFIEETAYDVFEEAVSVAASFASTLETQESLLDLLFVGDHAYCFTAGRGLAHSDQMLEILASVRPTAEQPFDKLEQLVLEHSNVVSGCVCVLVGWDAPRQQLVRRLRALNVPLLVLVITEQRRRKALEPGPMSDSPEQFHVLEAGRIEEGLNKLTS